MTTTKTESASIAIKPPKFSTLELLIEGTAPLVIARINQAFANSSAEVRAESERACVLGFVSMFFRSARERLEE